MSHGESAAERIQKSGPEHATIRAELIEDLCRPQASIAPKYFYDAFGSKLFEMICELDEYYLTRTEAAIMAQHAAGIAESVGVGTTLIDLGAGNCAKAASLFHVLRPRAYVPVDISVAFLRGAVEILKKSHPHIPMHPVGLDFSDFWMLPASVQEGYGKKLFFYPGSSLGNFTPLQAAKFLARIRAACDSEGALLLGIDLVKPAEELEAAYDDALGVTAAFNRNILQHVNRLLDSDFRPRDWQHKAVFNAAQSRVEMYLCARKELTVTWPGGARQFARGAEIHTENSYKYSRAAILDLLQRSGFGEVRCWSDVDNRYLVCHARAT
ncbi:MAG TPA: L-histidine N(alpha)-methyltransferase [Acidocella sp.]|jgi:dimethylhistidine N-methyltransferase|uniref:L-histidine N(alpha)-methyltransferase n=1 Tax=Acidocella sp. TaxID=50710 RepID=UPI002CD316C4|nr:L-histidine N(alpha)-methyltransferase [Acidocella sp.]HVE21857.1 L-histidine N(alpha)-methyltransferase [Acidocella sp.]